MKHVGMKHRLVSMTSTVINAKERRMKGRKRKKKHHEKHIKLRIHGLTSHCNFNLHLDVESNSQTRCCQRKKKKKLEPPLLSMQTHCSLK